MQQLSFLKVRDTFTPITIQEVSQIINRMANDKAPGVDGFTPQIIKELHKILLSYDLIVQFITKNPILSRYLERKKCLQFSYLSQMMKKGP